jgi:hypothetical protein
MVLVQLIFHDRACLFAGIIQRRAWADLAVTAALLARRSDRDRRRWMRMLRRHCLCANATAVSNARSHVNALYGTMNARREDMLRVLTMPITMNTRCLVTLQWR